MRNRAIQTNGIRRDEIHVKMRATLAAFALAAAGLMVTAAPAQAVPVEEAGTFSGTETYTECDGAYVVESTFSGAYVILEADPSTDGQFFPFAQVVHFNDTITNPETGEYITVTGTLFFKEMQPYDLGNGIVAYVGREIGTVTFRDSSGEVILREYGIVRIGYVFDTENDSAPGGTLLLGRVLSVKGPHPTYEADFDFCAFLDSEIGSPPSP
ncbi:MAG: hypothetical protein M3381_11310 [Actinomycetota bacterium]|nr:hypothetical protein [Actinomycetota bacterium]